jgi:hypothetical protein
MVEILMGNAGIVRRLTVKYALRTIQSVRNAMIYMGLMRISLVTIVLRIAYNVKLIL